LRHRQDVRRSGQEESTRRRRPVDGCLDRQQQLRGALELIDEDRRLVLDEARWIVSGGRGMAGQNDSGNACSL
jgi:hypothetical protein